MRQIHYPRSCRAEAVTLSTRHRSSAKLSKEEALVKLNDETDRVIITIAGVAPQSIKVREIRNLKPKDFLGDDGGQVLCSTE